MVIKEELEKYLLKRMTRAQEMGVEKPTLIPEKGSKRSLTDRLLPQYTPDSITISIGGGTKDRGHYTSSDRFYLKESGYSEIKELKNAVIEFFKSI